MNLTLKYEPTPLNAPKFAEDIVIAAREISDAGLDYSIESLAVVEAVIDEIRADGVPVEAVAETLFGFGCYVGEVLIHAAQGEWITGPDEGADYLNFPFIVRFPNGSWGNPLNRVFKRFERGEEASIPYFADIILKGARKGNSV